ncbi:hypothetical protein BSKO_13775 [Bryopsis sp. KO-2023]|nr:hypothetical protein BSKO_13775 [Bryopsis sp. KO-2023]
MLSVWLALIPVAIGCFRYLFSPTRQALSLIRQKVIDIGDAHFRKPIVVRGDPPRALPKRLLSATSLCESAIPAFLKGACSASYSTDTPCSENDSEVDWPAETCNQINSPPGSTTTDDDTNLHLAEKLSRAVVPADVETVLRLAWVPPEDSIWLEQFPRSASRSTHPQQDVERELLTSLTFDRCRDSAREMISSPCDLWWTGESDGPGSMWVGRLAGVTPPLPRWESQTMVESPAGEIQELQLESCDNSFADRTRTLNLQARLNGTAGGRVRRLDRDILLMHPTLVIDALVAVILGESTSAWQRTAAADVLCWFSLHPTISLRSDMRRRVVEAVISAALGETEEVKHTGLRAIRNLLEDRSDTYAQAFVEDMYLPWVLSVPVDAESMIYLNEILFSIEDKTEHSVSLLIGANAMVATKKTLSFLGDLMSDERASTTAVRDHLVPCALSSLMRYMSTDVIEELCAGENTSLRLLIDAVSECVCIDSPFPQETAVGVIEKMLLCSDPSPMKEIIYQMIVTMGGVTSLFEVLGSGTQSYQLSAMDVLHRIHAWDSMVLASLIGVDENRQLGRVLTEGLGGQKRSILLLIQKVWYQRMSRIDSGMVRKIVGLINDEDPKVRDVSVCTLATMVLTESPQKEISNVIVRNLIHMKAILLSRSSQGVNHRLVADLLMRFLEGGDRGIRISTIHMIRDIVSDLDLSMRINKRILGSVCRIFPTLFKREDSELARVLFDMFAEAGHQRPDIVAEIIFENVAEIGHVWNLYDHMHLELAIETLQGFGRVLWQLRNLERRSLSR